MMLDYFASGLPLLAVMGMLFIVVAAGLIFYALRNKGDVFAEFTHGKTTLRIDAKARHRSSKT